jgi:hypothetical protein
LVLILPPFEKDPYGSHVPMTRKQSHELQSNGKKMESELKQINCKGIEIMVLEKGSATTIVTMMSRFFISMIV